MLSHAIYFYLPMEKYCEDNSPNNNCSIKYKQISNFYVTNVHCVKFEVLLFKVSFMFNLKRTTVQQNYVLKLYLK